MSFEENKKLGFFKLYRSMINWEWFKDSSTLHVFIYCLLKANHKDQRYKGDVVKRGSFFTSRKIIAEETGMTERKVRTALEHLKMTNELTILTSSKGTVISVNNYDDYQKVTNELTNERPTSDQRPTTNKNEKNIKNVVVSDDTPTTTTIFDDDFVRFWKAYQKKGSKKDTYEVWKEHEFDEQEIDLVIFAAKEYSKENASDRTSMMYSRTFLENEIYLDYQDKFKKYKVYLKEQEELDEIRKKLKMKDGYE
ncbi:hypothetical protein [Faecalibacillus faecis]|uniref:hypothetical protein n=1 Tax=Faecalibacillus faecis TaxID=1982628 RepID=UPI002F9281A5